MFEFDHIGVAVHQIQDVLGVYNTIGWEEVEIEEVPSEKVRVGFLPFKNHVNIELLEPTDETSVIANFLKKRGPGVHHICFRVKNLKSHLIRLKEKGVQLVDESPRPGAKGCQVAFIHPRSTGGVLIELSEKKENVS